MHWGVKSWAAIVKFLWYYFSLHLLFATFFAPWRRYSEPYPREFKISAYVAAFVANLFSRLVGAFARAVVILIGLAVLAAAVCLLPLFLLLPVSIKYETLVKAGSIGRSWSYGFTPFLDAHARDLSAVPEKKLFERDDEINQMEMILGRERQDNVLLLGQPGVGKTTLVEQFAKRVSWGLTLPVLNNRRVLEFLPEGLSRGEIKQCLDEAVKAGDIILVIENFDAYAAIYGLLLPYLEASEFQVIGTTGYDGYHHTIKSYDEVTRLFELVQVEELSAAAALGVLADFAKRRRAKIAAEVLEEIVRRTDQLIQNVPQPEKSIDLLEELLAAKKKITVADVHHLLEEKTGVPIGEVAARERETLLNLEAILGRKVIGQPAAIKAVADALRRARAGVRNPKKPVGAFLFLGPTGVGKTHTAKALAEAYFGSEEQMIRFDMSEFQAATSAERLMNRLTDAVETKPFSLLFLDEVEKAHANILDIFLQVLDEGRLTSISGRTVSLKNTIIIATSNAGSEMIRLMVKDGVNLESGRGEVIDSLQRRGIFKPEFLNRYDGVILFKTLSHDDLEKIAALQIAALNKRLASENKPTVAPTTELIKRIAELGYQPEFGARPMNRVIQDNVENKIAEAILSGRLKAGDVMEIII